MGYVLSILMNALQTWLLTKLWDSFFTRRFNGKQFWAYWLLWTAIITVVLNVLPNDYDYSNIIRFLIEIAHEYAMSLMLYRSRWDRRLFVVITGYACFFSISVLTEKAWLLYSGMTRTEYVYNKPLYTAFIFCGGCALWRLLYWFGISTHRRRKTESRAHGYRHQHCSHCVHCLCFTGCSTQKVPQVKMPHGRFACL